MNTIKLSNKRNNFKSILILIFITVLLLQQMPMIRDAYYS